MADLDNYMPPQWSAQENVDLRGAIMGVASKRAENVGDKKNNSVLHVGRYKTMGKRKRGGEDEGEEEMDEDEMEERREKAMKVIVDPTIYGNGKGSGRKWKAPAQKASSLKKSVPTKAWEKKMRDRDLHKRMQVRRPGVPTPRSPTHTAYCCARSAFPATQAPRPVKVP